MSFTIKAAQGPDFVNREKELGDILSTLSDPSSTMGFALYGRRRMGKTSLFKEVARRLCQSDGIVPVYFSLWDLNENSVLEFCKELSQTVIEAYRPHLKLKYRAKEIAALPVAFIKKLLSELKVSVELEESLSLVLSAWDKKKKDSDSIVNDAFDLPEKLAGQMGKKTVLLIDEFPDIVDLKMDGKKIGEPFIKKIRTINEDYRRTSLNISGSIRKTMEAVAFSSASAFYRQFVAKEIGPLTKENARLLMERNLEGKKMEEGALDSLCDFTGGVPFYVQFLGRLMLKIANPAITTADVERTINEFLEEEGSLLFTEEWERLGDYEKQIISVMAESQVSSYADVSRQLKSDVANIGQYLLYLEEKGIIEKISKGQYCLSDKIFKQWLMNRAQGIGSRE